MPLQAITSTEPIPGYRIRDRIGSGGYGEVWRADAPGGLAKAIKFVYGVLTEDRASRELKSLNRIKSVRHPFLLSLERIEVVDGQLLIVTELAETSLKERFENCRQEGLRGIPWEELMRFLSDAADVLDYMSEEHSLQHLDIKPENLLMLAGRVKVADFGLVKDIHDATASMMGGLTPLYAPPEVFDGRPSRWSDQYSLAIVYQEMLTGNLPFPGTTAIQLARQHLNARPQLSALTEWDQEVIARALSKSPQDRFKNCRALVDALRQSAARESADTATDKRAGTESTQTDRNVVEEQKRQTAALEETPRSRPWQRGSGSVTVPHIHASPVVHDLPPIEIPPQPPPIEPTLFLGVGRSASRIMLKLRTRLADRFQSLDTVPALQMLLLDTDNRHLMEASCWHGGFRPDELLATPLRRPKDYRASSREYLQWLSRRWLYNIPRSLKTEGLRPLGRLALIDHAARVMDRIRTAIDAATSAEALTRSRENSGLDFRSDTIRILVISSTAGGTGSGMVVDLGYLARYLLRRAGFPDANVCGVLTHSTPHNPRISELALVNTYATLTELNHYGRLGSCYPGERAFDMPPRRDDNLAFHNTYLIDMGHSLSEDQFEEAADSVAEYLYLDTTTAANQFFSGCRDSEPRHASTRNTEIPLRSFGVYQRSCLRADIVSVAVEYLCRHTIERWMTGTCTENEATSSEQPTAPADRHVHGSLQTTYAHLQGPVEELASSVFPDADMLVRHASHMIETELGTSPKSYVTAQLEERTNGTPPASRQDLDMCLANVSENTDQLLGDRQNDMETGHAAPGTLEDSLAPRRRKFSLECAGKITNWVLDQVEQQHSRIGGSQWAAHWFAAHCNTLEDHIAELQADVGRSLNELHQRLDKAHAAHGRGKDREPPKRMLELTAQFYQLRFHERAVESAASIARVINSQLARLCDDLVDLERELRHVADQFAASRSLRALRTDDAEDSDALLQSIERALSDNMEQLADQLEHRLERDLLQHKGGLRKAFLAGGSAVNDLPATMREVGRTIVVGLIRQLDASDVLFPGAEETQNAADTISAALKAATPPLLACGGAKRLLVMLPNGPSRDRPIELLRQDMQQEPTIVQNREGDFILCYEVEQISLTQAAVTIIDRRQDLAEAASRLHTRNDIEWSRLPDLT